MYLQIKTIQISQIVFLFIVQALDLWMAGCMIFVFAALGEFVVVKVLDVQYQYQINRVPKVLPMVNIHWVFLLFSRKCLNFNIYLPCKIELCMFYFFCFFRFRELVQWRKVNVPPWLHGKVEMYDRERQQLLQQLPLLVR